MLAKNAVTRPMDPIVDLIQDIQVIQGTVSRKAWNLPKKTRLNSVRNRNVRKPNVDASKCAELDGTTFSKLLWMGQNTLR